MRPAATIVVPLLRQNERWLEQALRSVLGQTVPCELIVVPSPHTPLSNLAVVERLLAATGSARGYASPVHGFPQAVNAGFRMSRTDRVGILLSDDWLDSTAVEECLELPTDIVSTGLRSVDDKGSALPALDRALDMDGFLQQPTLEAQAAYLTHFLLFRRSVIEAANGLDETLGDAPGIDDYDMVWTLLERQATVGITRRPLYNYRVHAGERLTLRSREQQLQTLIRILAKHGVQEPDRAKLLDVQAMWLGRSEDVVFAARMASRATAAPGSS